MELEKALKGSDEAGAQPSDALYLEEDDLPVVSSSAVALQQTEVKKEMLHTLMDPKQHAVIR